MAGLDKMKSQILNEAKAAADAKTAKAISRRQKPRRDEAASPRNQQQIQLIIKSVSHPPSTCSAERRFLARSRR